MWGFLMVVLVLVHGNGWLKDYYQLGGQYIVINPTFGDLSAYLLLNVDKVLPLKGICLGYFMYLVDHFVLFYYFPGVCPIPSLVLGF